MRTLLFTLMHFVAFSIQEVHGQVNLVPDPSFEDTTAFVTGLGQESLKTWRNLDSTRPNSCPFGYFSYSPNNNFKLPDNQWFYQQARSGNGVAELEFVYVFNPSYQRTLARTRLTSSLQNGKSYCVKMYVNTFDKYVRYASDGIQIYFDNGQLDTIMSIDSSGIYPFVQPQVSNPQGNIINDTAGWTMVSGIFTAMGTETFLTIGNFKTNANTDTAVLIPSSIEPFSGLIIDDVSVLPIDISNWLQDTYCVLGDSVYIGLPKYEIPDAQWFDASMQYIGKGSGIYVTPIQPSTKYIQAIDVCSSIRYDTLKVYATPVGTIDIPNTGIRIWPNPTNESVFVEYQNKDTEAIQLYSMYGELLFTKELDSLNKGASMQIDLSGLAKGMYFIKIGKVYEKIIKQ